MKQYEGKPFELVGVNLDRSPIDGLNGKLEHGLTWRSFHDKRYAIAEAYGLFSSPTVFIIDSKGKIQWIGEEYNDELIAQLVADIQ